MIIIGFFLCLFLLVYNVVALFIVLLPCLGDMGHASDNFLWLWLAAVFALVVEVQVYVWTKPWLVQAFPHLKGVVFL